MRRRERVDFLKVLKRGRGSKACDFLIRIDTPESLFYHEPIMICLVSVSELLLCLTGMKLRTGPGLRLAVNPGIRR